MNYRGKKDVRVFNECPFQVNLVGQRNEYIFPPCMDGEPTMNYIDFDEIEYANSRGKVFKTGLLTFAESEQEDIYRELSIKDWATSVWRNADIEDIILHPNLDKIQKVIDIRDVNTFERVRGMMVRFVNEGRDVPQKVINLVNARYRELSSGVLSSKIVVRATDIAQPVASEEVNDLRRQIAEMQKMIEAMTQTKNAQATATEPEAGTQQATPAKKPGRKPATKK